MWNISLVIFVQWTFTWLLFGPGNEDFLKLTLNVLHFFSGMFLNITIICCILQKSPLPELIYMADNLAYFPYQSQDETLFIIHQIDILVSVSGSNLLQSFHEVKWQWSIFKMIIFYEIKTFNKQSMLFSATIHHIFCRYFIQTVRKVMVKNVWMMTKMKN